MTQLVVDGVVQSVFPPPDWGYWKHMVPDVEPKSVIMLGVGLGTVAKMIQDKWPKVKIQGVDNNPSIFGKIQADMDTIEMDAFEYIEEQDRLPYLGEPLDGYDLILVDLWNGGWYPTQVFKPEFMNRLRKLLNPEGKIYINAPNIKKCAQLNNLKVRAESEGESIIYETI